MNTIPCICQKFQASVKFLDTHAHRQKGRPKTKTFKAWKMNRGHKNLRLHYSEADVFFKTGVLYNTTNQHLDVEFVTITSHVNYDHPAINLSEL